MKAHTAPVTFESARALAEQGAPLGAEEMAAIFRIGISAFYKRAKVGTYDRLKLSPPLGKKPYSGVLVSKYLKGEPLYIPSFGRRRTA